MKKNILFFLVIILMSCKLEKERYVYGETIDFEVYSSSYWSGYVDNGDFFYTTNLETRTMRFYDRKGKELKTYSFEHLIDPHSKGFQVKVLSRNDMYLLDYATRIIYRIDSIGEVKTKVAFYEKEGDTAVWPYFTDDINGMDKETILLDLAYMDLLNNGSLALKIEGEKHKPCLGKIENFDTNATVIYSNLTPVYLTEQANKNKEEHFSGYSSALLCEDKVYFMDQTANLIYVLDRETLQVVNTVRIESDYTNTSIENFTFYAKDKAMNFTDYNYEYAASAKQIVYDPYRDTFLVVLAHRVDVEENPEQKFTNRPFSIITYDRQLSKIDEQLVYNRKYNFYKTIFPIQEGLLIHSNSKMNPTYKTKTLSYDLFKIQ